MFCKLYLKRKFQKNISEYICIFIIMVVSVMLINVPSVFLDSVEYGAYLDWQERTGGYDVRLDGALPSDIDFFSEVQGIETTYKDGCICIKIDDSVDWDYTANHISYIVGQKSLDIDVHVYAYPDSADPEQVFFIDFIKIVFTVIGMLSIYFAYSLLREQRKEELKKIVRLGIDKKTLRNTLIVELLVVFVAALAVAVPISNLAVKVTIDAFFKKSVNYIVIAYDYRFSSLVLLIFLALTAICGAFALSWNKIIESDEEDIWSKGKGTYFRRYINTSAEEKSVSSNSFLTKIFFWRDGKYSIPCFIITTVTVTLITFMIVLVSVFFTEYSDHDISVSADLSQLYERADEIEAAFAEAEKLPYFSEISYTTNYTSFVTALNATKRDYSTYGIVEGVRYFRVSIIPLDDEQGAELGMYEALVPEDTKMAIFDDGKLRLCTIHGVYEDSHGHVDESKVLNIVGKSEYISTSNSLHVYVNRETFTAVTDHEPVRQSMKMELYDEYDVETVIEELGEIFDDSTLFRVTNYDQIRREQMNNDKIVIAIILVMSTLLMLCGSTLVYVFNTMEAIKNAPMIEKLLRLGSDYKMTVKPLARASWLKGLFSYILGTVLGTCLITIYSAFEECQYQIGLFSVLVGLMLFVLISVLHIMPIATMVKKVISRAYIRVEGGLEDGFIKM